MNALLQEIKSSLLRLIVTSIEALPAILVAIAILPNPLCSESDPRMAIAGKRMLKSQSLRSLLVQMSYVAVVAEYYLHVSLLFQIWG